MEFAKRIARSVLPLNARIWLRKHVVGGLYDDYAAFEAESRIGADSPNAWIRKSAQIGGWMFAGEHEFLWELSTRREAAGDVIEIGTWMGKSACILAGACAETASGTRVVCVDTFRMTGTQSQETYHRRIMKEQPGTFYQFLANADRFGFMDLVVPIAAFSTRALPLLRGPFRMAFVDGAHDRENCQRDCELCFELLARGGVLAVHDATGGLWPGVEEYVNGVLHRCPALRHLGTRGTVVAFEKLADGPLTAG
jgi:hypothetical protein